MTRGAGSIVAAVLLAAALSSPAAPVAEAAESGSREASENASLSDFRLPVKVQLAAQYMPVHPDQFGQKWNLQLLFAPVLPKLVKGNLAEPKSLRFELGG